MNFLSSIRNCLLLGGLLSGVGATSAQAANFTVLNLNDSGAGSLRQAILDANSNNDPTVEDTIYFASTVRGTINLTTVGDSNQDDSAFLLKEKLKIEGPGANLLSVQRSTAAGTANFRLISVPTGATVTLSGLTLKNGKSLGVGGAIYSVGTLTVQNCILASNNAETFGGAIRNSFGTLTVQNSTIANNSTNASNSGGGIESSGTLLLSNSTVAGNAIPGGGTSGGGGGAGLWIQDSATITNCTITGNSAGGADSASGIYVTDGSVALSNTIVAGNMNNAAQPDVMGTFTSSGFNLLGNPGDLTGFNAVGDQTGNSLAPLDPQLGALVDNGGGTQTCTPLTGSPVLDAGNSTLSDQRGTVRPIDLTNTANASGSNGADIGAVELDTPQSGNNFVVNSTDDHGDGMCGINDCSLRDAVNAANSNGNPTIEDTITFAPNVWGALDLALYDSDTSYGRSAIVITQKVNIQGPGAALLTLRRSASVTTPLRIFRIPSGVTARISGLTLRNGYGNFNAGSGVSNSGNLTLTDSTITESENGAIYDDGTILVQNCNISNNTRYFADCGGIQTGNVGTVTVQNTVFANNVGLRGGAIFSDSGAVIKVQNCTFSGNASNVNTIDSGGAIESYGALDISNSTFSGNTVTKGPGSGGALCTKTTKATNLTNCTFTGNSVGSPNSAGAIACSVGTINIKNTIVAANVNNTTQPDVLGSFTSSGYNLIGNVGNATGFTVTNDQKGTASAPLDPKLGPLADNGGPTQTIALLPGSPAIDKASATGTDQRGLPRPVDLPGTGNAQGSYPGGNGADIGAYEKQDASGFQSGPDFVVNTLDDGDNGCTTSHCSLREAFTAANVNSDTSVITFDPTVFANKATISLTNGRFPEITSSLSILGPTAPGAGVTIKSPQLSYLTLFSVNSGTFVLSDLTLTGNANAILTFAGTITAQNCTFDNNQYGLHVLAGFVTARNCTFTGSLSGISASSTMTVQSCTFTNNSGGLYINDSNARINLSNSIVAGNRDNINGPINDLGYNLSNDNGRGSLTASTDRLYTDPGFDPAGLKDNSGPTQTFALVAGSPAIDKGNATGTDQRGLTRPVELIGASNAVGGNGADIGAYEKQDASGFQGGPNFVVNTLDDSDNGCTSSHCSLREAIGAANGASDTSAITFDATVFATKATITLTQGNLPPIASDVNLTGPSAAGAGVTLQNTMDTGGNGSLQVNSGVVSITNLTFTKGDTGVSTVGGTTTLTGCTFSGNTTNGLANRSTVTLSNCTFSDNRGAGLGSFQGTLNMDSCTLTGNYVGIYPGASAVNLSNSLVVGNSINILQGTTFATNANNITTGTAVAAGLDPAGLKDNGGPTTTVALLCSGTAVDAGSTTLVSDQRGTPRPQRGADDIGAFEMVNSPPVVSSVSIDKDSPKTNETITAVTNVQDANGDPTILSYQWTKGGAPLQGETGKTLDLSKAGNGDRGDSIAVKVTSIDGFDSGSPITSNSVTIVNSAPTMSGVAIAPSAPDTNDTLRFSVGTLADDDGDTITSSYQWRKNGQNIDGQTGDSLDLLVAGNGDKGDKISVVVSASDGTDSTSSESPAVTVGNSAPAVSSVALDNYSPSTDDTLTATYEGSDPDTGDQLTPTYVWKNGTTIVQQGTNAKLDLSKAGNGDKGDKITVTVTANDGTNDSASLTSAVATVINSAPVVSIVTITPGTPKTNSLLTAHVVASDADANDKLTYSYVWKKGATIVQTGRVSQLDLNIAGNGDRGDSITVTVTATDASNSSATKTSDAALVGNTAPTVSSVVLSPTTATTNSLLSATVTASDIDPGDTLTYKYVWKNGTMVLAGETGDKLDLSKAGNGDNGNQITVTVTANDGIANSAPLTSTPVTVGNSVPMVSIVTITPGSPKTNSLLTAHVVANDADAGTGDALTYSYVWKNGATIVQQGKVSTLDLNVAGNGDRGDSITVTVTATDKAGATGSKTSDPALVGNTAPVLSGVALTPTNPLTNTTLSANATASDLDAADVLSYKYAWKKNGQAIVGEVGKTLDLSKAGNGDKGDSVTVTTSASDGSLNSAALTSNTVIIGNSAPKLVSVAPQSATDTVASKRTLSVLVSEPDGARDIKSMTLLINTQLDQTSGATLFYEPSASDPTSGTLTLRGGNQTLASIPVGAGSSSSAVLDNGALRIVGSDVTVTVNGNSLTLTVPATIEDGLVGNNTLFARVEDRSGALDAASNSAGFVSFGPYTVKPQFASGTNHAPTLTALTNPATTSTLSSTGVAPAQTFSFSVRDEEGTGDLQSVYLLAGKQRSWTGTATFIYTPKTQRLSLLADDGKSTLGGNQIGTSGVLENSQVRVDMAQVKVTYAGDGKTLTLTLPLQAKSGLLGQNTVYLRVQDLSGAVAPGSDAQGYIKGGTWTVNSATAAGTTPQAPSPSGGNS